MNASISSISRSDNPLPLIFDSPHSGRVYPEDFRFSCPFEILEKAEDNYVDELFQSVPAHGGALLCALFPRTYIDVNRALEDIDPELLAEGFEAHWPYEIKPSNRSHAGIGLIRRLVRPGIPVYDCKLDIREILYRIDNYYKPYHNQLADLIDEAHYNFGQSWHVNCHSMPHGAGMGGGTGSGLSRALTPGALAAMPDFVLGDRDGTSCDLAFTHAMRDFLKGLGYRVAINNPYRGVELLRRHAAPATGRHSIQIEISKALYWDETSNRKSRNYSDLKDDIEKLIKFCADYVSANLADMAAD